MGQRGRKAGFVVSEESKEKARQTRATNKQKKEAEKLQETNNVQSPQ